MESINPELVVLIGTPGLRLAVVDRYLQMVGFASSKPRIEAADRERISHLQRAFDVRFFLPPGVDTDLTNVAGEVYDALWYRRAPQYLRHEGRALTVAIADDDNDPTPTSRLVGDHARATIASISRLDTVDAKCRTVGMPELFDVLGALSATAPAEIRLARESSLRLAGIDADGDPAATATTDSAYFFITNGSDTPPPSDERCSDGFYALWDAIHHVSDRSGLRSASELRAAKARNFELEQKLTVAEARVERLDTQDLQVHRVAERIRKSVIYRATPAPIRSSVGRVLRALRARLR